MKQASLLAVGDVMLGDHPVCYGHGIRSTIRKHGLAHLTEPVTDLLENKDFIFCNLEGVLSHIGNDDNILKKSELRGDPDSAAALAKIGFNLVNVANNHMLQHGHVAFLDTLSHLEKAGIDSFGLYEPAGSNVVQKSAGGIDFTFVGYSLRPERYYSDNTFYAQTNKTQILSQVSSLKGKYPNNHIVVSLHWGDEYLNYPSGDQIDFAHALIDSGCALLLGHHPHVLQGFEKYKSGLIAYSLGNFIFDKWQRNPRETAALECQFDEKGLCGFQIHPLLIAKNFQITRPDNRKLLQIESSISDYSNAIKDRGPEIIDDIAAYQELATKAYFSFRMQSYAYFIMHLWKYKPTIIFGSLFRFIQRRIGLG